MRWPRFLAPPAIVAGSLVVLLSAVVLGVSFSALRLFPPFGGRPQLGNALQRTGIAPLTDRFVGQVLGPGETPVGRQLDRVTAQQRAPSPEGPNLPLVHPPDNNDQRDAYPVMWVPFTGRTSTTDATREQGEPECGPQLGGTVWYRYTAVRSETLRADTSGTGYQTSLAVYRRSTGGLQLLPRGCDFDSNGNSQVKADVASGTTYLFQVAAAVKGGDLTFHLSRFGELTLESVSSDGKTGNENSEDVSISAGGRYVAFASQAANLVAGMEARQCRGVLEPVEEACWNVFLRDRRAGTTRLVSVGLGRSVANEHSRNPQVSDDGRYVLFESKASNLVRGDTNGVSDAFVRDMRTGRIERVSLSDRGDQVRPGPISSRDPEAGYFFRSVYAQGGASRSSMSADGRYVAFQSHSPHLVAGDTDELLDVFVRDRLENTTRLASFDDRRTRSSLGVALQSISRNGRWIVLISYDAMSEQDRDQSQDVFVRDLSTGATELVSVPGEGQELEGFRDAASGWWVSQRSISDDGRYVVFGTDGAFVDGDTNGVYDVFVRDRVRQTTERVSVSSSGEQGIASTSLDQLDLGWSISGDGRMVAFSSNLSLEPGDGDIAQDIYLHDRSDRVVRRLSPGNGNEHSLSPQISGDGMHTAFFSYSALTSRDNNRGSDVYVFSTEPVARVVAPAAAVPAAPCPASSEYTRVGLRGAHEDVIPSLLMAVPGHLFEEDDTPPADSDYPEDSAVRFKYRIDVSGASTFARTVDVGFELRWDNGLSDYDIYVYDARGNLIGHALNNGLANLNNSDPLRGDTHGIEIGVLPQVPQCMDIWVDVVNYMGLPPKEMTLDITLGSPE